jgi:branched-chain amino acid transport system ATP-binding protein
MEGGYVLEVIKIDVRYGKVHAIKDVSLRVNPEEFISVIGSNGAGKSTLLKTISGLLRPASGRIIFLGDEISRISPNAVVDRGIGHIPEGRKLFTSLTVLENLEMGAYVAKARGKRDESLGRVFALFPVLKERQKQLSGTLSGGEQQMLAIARGLMAEPRLLLFDEPSWGLAPMLVRQTMEVIVEVNRTGTTILLVEQNVRYALLNSSRAYVLENGMIVMEGSGRDLISNSDVKTAYLGL